MIEAVVFDFDGLIVDTEALNYHVTREAYGQFNVVLSLEIWHQVFHQSSEIQHRTIEAHYGVKLDFDEIANLRTSKFREGMHMLQPRSGVKAYLDDAKKLGLKIGLATNADRYYIEEIFLKRLDLLQYFDCIRTKEDVTKKKPDPEVYRSVLEGLQILPQHAIAFEDSPIGAVAAKLAGMRCVVVPNYVTEKLVFADDIDHRLSSMSEMRFEELIKLLSGG